MERSSPPTEFESKMCIFNAASTFLIIVDELSSNQNILLYVCPYIVTERVNGMGVREGFYVLFFNSYFIALGVILGGCIVGGLGAFFIGNPPLLTMVRLASNLKIWAIVAAIGGSFEAFYSFEKGIFDANTRDIIKQLFIICSATGGAQTGSLIISWLAQEDGNL